MYLIHAITPINLSQNDDYLIEYTYGDDYHNVQQITRSATEIDKILGKTANNIHTVIFEEDKHTGIMQTILGENKVGLRVSNVVQRGLIALLLFMTIIGLGKSLEAQSWTVKDNCNQLAIILESRYQIPAELTLAIYAHESAHGTSNVALRYNNYFGIRQRTVIDDYDYYSYRKFDSKVQCFVWFGNMLRNGKIYPECLDQDIENIVLCMADKGYSQDPEWANHIITLINQK